MYTNYELTKHIFEITGLLKLLCGTRFYCKMFVFREFFLTDWTMNRFLVHLTRL